MFLIMEWWISTVNTFIKHLQSKNEYKYFITFSLSCPLLWTETYTNDYKSLMDIFNMIFRNVFILLFHVDFKHSCIQMMYFNNITNRFKCSIGFFLASCLLNKRCGSTAAHSQGTIKTLHYLITLLLCFFLCLFISSFFFYSQLHLFDRCVNHFL